LTELAADLAAKRVSAVELTKHFLARIELYDDALNAFVTVTAGRR
jgi:aspartyl-tRNA(Asn)/glutamyl-tRNA(Gln) amidotransferase subunit A